MPDKYVVPLTHAEKRIYLTQKLYPESSMWNIPFSLRLAHADLERLQEAVRLTVGSFPGLHVVFHEGDAGPVKYIDDTLKPSIATLDFSEQGEQAYLQWADAQSKEPIPMLEKLPYSMTIADVGDGIAYVFIKIHHIAVDGGGMDLFCGRIVQVYDDLAQGRTTAFPEPPDLGTAFRNEQEYVESEAFTKDRAYWNTLFETIPDPMDIAGRVGTKSLELAVHDHSFSSETTRELLAFCSENKVSPFRVVLAAMSVVLFRTLRREDLIFGTATANRYPAGLRDAVGMFVNTCALKIQVDPAISFRDLVRHIGQTVRECRSHGRYPYDILASDIRSRTGETPDLISCTLVEFISTPLPEHAEMQLHNFGESLAPLAGYLTFPRPDDPDDSRVSLKFDFHKDTFEPWRIKALARHIEEAIAKGVRHPETPVSGVSFLPASQLKTILSDFNKTTADWEMETTLPECIGRTMKRFPGRTAVVYRGQSLTYGELDARSNALARTLTDLGAHPGSVVGLLADRSLDIIIAQLAILKTGAAFMPIDSEYPEDRVRFMLDDIAAPILVTQQRFLAERDPGEAAVVDLDSPASFSEDTSPVQPPCTPHDLCCVIYTSGSTGTPKGVLLEHRSICNIINATIHSLKITPEDRIAKYMNFSFDPSLMEVFSSLMSGAQLHLVPEEIRLSLSHLNEFFESNGITWACMTTQLGEQFMDFVESTSLRILIVGGEKLRTFVPRSYELLNQYGPTECSIYSTMHHVTALEENIPIGKPAPNYSLFIVDKHNNPQPPGYGGEICIHGPGLARCYHNREDKTAESFVPCPFFLGETMYRTGDLGSWTPEGVVLHLGRIDRQVKMRGFRIELGEIENAMLAVEGVDEAAVGDFKDKHGHVYLCGYVCGSADIGTVTLQLNEKLPPFMVPASMIRLETMPLTPNGKIDRKKLPEPTTSVQEDDEYVAPVTGLERTLCTIWGEVLDRETISVEANFFQSGGDSLRAVALQVVIAKTLARDVELPAIFEHPTPRNMAAFLETSKNEQDDKIRPAPPMDWYPTTISQQQLFLLNRMKGIGTVYNMPLCIRFQGDLDRKRLSTVLLTLLERHESLRTAFAVRDGKCVQQVMDDVHLKLDFARCASHAPAEFATGFMRPFDLSRPPLMQAKLITHESGVHRLLLDFHHIAFDGVSVGVFLKELFTLYQGGNPGSLPFQHKDFAFFETSRQKESEAAHQSFWFDLFDQVPEAELPADFPRPSHQDFAGDVFRHRLEDTLADKIRSLARTHGATLHQVFMAAIGILLGRWSGNEDVCLGTSMSGRDRAGTSRLIGMFVRTLPARIRPAGEKTFTDLLLETRGQMLSMHEHGEYPISSLYEHLGANRGPGRHPLFDVNFVMRNIGVESRYELDNVIADIEPLELGTAKFDISFALEDDTDNLTLETDFRTGLYRRETIARMTGHLCRILDAVADEPDNRLMDIDILLPQERENLLNRFNPAPTAPPAWPTVCQAIADHARTHPDHIAVRAQDGSLTYAELDRLANRGARSIREHGGGKNVIVAVVADRSIWSVAGMLAALKSGSAYVGLDTAYPEDRVAFILDDTRAPCILGTTAQLAGIDHDRTGIAMDGPLPEDDTDPDFAEGGDALAYCIFTSGSTGTPKGVLIEHHSMVNFINWYATHHRMDGDSACAAFAAFSFDVSVVQVFAPLVAGSTLHVIPEDLRRSPKELDAYFTKNRVTHAHFPTRFAEQFMRMCTMDSLRYLIVGGDALRSYRLGNFRLTNEYGPSETTMACLSYDVPERMAKTPIGSPVANTRIYILDERDRLCPMGVPGEICVSGAGVGRGYLNRPELTDKHFTDNPFLPGERIFRTGDKGCWLEDGLIDFIGRMDFQVKIRGYRIEPGEIESCLKGLDTVLDCVVVPLDDPGGNKVLAAYCTASEPLDAAEVRAFLGGGLPEYMVPAHIVQLDRLPMNRNGKVDRGKLPRPEITGKTAGPLAPRNPKEERIVRAWETVLGHRGFGLYDSFFDIGGDSLSAIGLLADLSDTYDISASDLFAHTTIADQAASFQEAEIGRSARLLGLKDLVRPPDEDASYEEQVAAYDAACKRDEDLDTETVQEPEHVLLTGATGTLGVYLLRELLQHTRARITAIVRGKDDQEAKKRLAGHYLERFKRSLDEDGHHRVEVLAGDLSKGDFGLSQEALARLTAEVDAILHSAALTSHYGDWEIFEAANVTSVANLAALARTGRAKTIHHVSTTSIGAGQIEGRARVLFTEFDVDLGQESGNLYVRSKLQAEKLLEQCRKEGLSVNVYRAGNITCDSQTGVFQSNVEDNGFYQQLRSYVNLGAAPDTTDTRNMSYVDQSAKAIVTAMTRPGLAGQTLHIHNPHVLSLSSALEDEALGLRLERMPFEEFVEFVAHHAGCTGFDTYIERLLVHLGWQDWLSNPGKTATDIRVERSAALFKRCGFSWKHPVPEDLALFVNKALEDRVEALRTLPGFRLLDKETLEAMAARVQPAHYQEAELIQQENRPQEQMSLLMDGMVETYRHSVQGWIGTVRVDGVGACFGEGSVLDGDKADNSVEALDQTHIYHFSMADMRRLIENHPRLGMVLLKLSGQKKNRAEGLFVAM